MSKTAVITGASRGLGRAMALRLAKDGFDIVVHYASNKAAADAVLAEIAAIGRKAFAVQADIAKVADINAMFTAIDEGLLEHTGEAQFDVLINNAGTAITKPMGEWTEADLTTNTA